MSATADVTDLSVRDAADVVVVTPPASIEPGLHSPAPTLPRGPALRLLPMPRQTERWPTRWVWTSVALILAGLYLFVLLSYWAPANPGVDQNGYLVGGRQFAATGSTGIRLASDYDFIGRMWVTAPSGINYPKYPLGLPILFAVCIWLAPITGWNGYEVAHLISPISSALATLGLFAITRRLAGGFAGVLGMLLLATGQVFLTLTINPNSHAAGTCVIVWGVYFLIRWLELGTLWRGLAAGFLLGFAYLIRYTDGLMLATLGVAMLSLARWRWPGWRVLGIGVGAIALAILTLALVGYFGGARLVSWQPWLRPLREADAYASVPNGLPFLTVVRATASAIATWYVGNVYRLLLTALALASFASLFVAPRALWRLLLVGLAWLVPVLYQTIFNLVAMGAFTSYANTNESTAFNPDDFSRNWELMIRTLHDQALFFIAPLGLLGLVLMARRMPMIAGLLALWFVPSVLLYTSYYWAPDMRGVSYSRFILTQVPALVIPAAWLLGEIVRRHGRFAWHVGPVGTLVLAWSMLGVGVMAVACGAVMFAPAREPLWWAVVPPGAVLTIAGATILIGRFITRDDVVAARHFHGSLARVAVGLVVFVACAVGLYRTTIGSEWGAQMNARASIEVQSRQNQNLAALGRAVRAAVPDGSVLFADGDRMHHLQFVGAWQMLFTDYFDLERVKRSMLNRSITETDNPDPIDPSRVRFLHGVYDKKDQAALRADLNDLIGTTLVTGRRVFYVLTSASSDTFRRTLDRRRFETTPITTHNDVPPPRPATEFLPPTERPRVFNRFGGARGGNLAGALGAGDRQSWRIVEIVAAKPQPATTRATTKSASQPMVMP